MENIDIYVSLYNKALNKTKSSARNEAISAYGSDDGKNVLLYPDCVLRTDELYFDDDENTIEICGEVYSEEVNLGYLNLSIPISTMSSDIIDNTINKLQKVKALLNSVN